MRKRWILPGLDPQSWCNRLADARYDYAINNPTAFGLRATRALQRDRGCFVADDWACRRHGVAGQQ